jgi:hypothetical protein
MGKRFVPVTSQETAVKIAIVGEAEGENEK